MTEHNGYHSELSISEAVVRMAFTWTSISVGDVIKADHINEIKNALDTLFAWEGVTWTWQYLPVSAGQIITYEQIKELRDATDYADDHKCVTEHATYNSGVDTAENSPENSEYLAVDLDINYDVIDDGHLRGYDSTDREGVDSGYNTTAYVTEHSTYCGTDYGTEHDVYNSTVKSAEDRTYNSTYNSPVNTGYAP